MSRKVSVATRSDEQPARASRKRKPPTNIASPPAGAVLILPTAPTDQAISSVAVLFKPDGSAVALRALTMGDGKWALPADLAMAPAATPIEARVALKQLRDLRNGTEAEVDRLIALLDQFDGDPDAEPQGDEEPSINANETHGRGWSWPSFAADDAEDDDEGEPWLGASTSISQTGWSAGPRP